MANLSKLLQFHICVCMYVYIYIYKYIYIHMYIPIQNLQGTWSAIKTEVLKLGPAVGSGLASVQKFIGVGVSGKGTDLGFGLK